MAKKQKGYESALGSIFDFIFTEAKKKPPKIKPPKYTGLKGTTEMTSALAEIASKPYLYLSDSALSAFGDFLGQSLVEIPFDKFDDEVLKGMDKDAGRFRVRTKELGKFFSNPRKYIDSVFEDAKKEREWGKYIGIGRGLDTGMFALWAKKRGLSTKEAFDLGSSAGHFVTLDMQNQGKKMQLENAAMIVLKGQNEHGLALKARDAIEQAATVTYDQASLRRILGPKLGITGVQLDQLVADILSENNGRLRGRYYTKENLSESRLNAMGYRTIYSENLLHRFTSIDPDSATTSAQRTSMIDQKRKLQEAKAVVDAINRVKRTGYAVGLPDFKDTVAQIDDEVNRLRNLGPLSPEDTRYVARLNGYKNNILSVVSSEGDRLQKAYSRRFWGFEKESDFKQVKRGLENAIDAEIEKFRYVMKSALSSNETAKARSAFETIRVLQLEKRSMQTMPGKDWRVRIANWVGAYRSIDGNIIKGGLVGGLISGSFFAQDVYMNPATRGNVSFFDKVTVGTRRVNREEKILLPRQDINGFYSSLAGLYYFTPSSIFKTLFFNGEGFTYGMYSHRRSIEKFFSRPDVVAQLRASGLMGQLRGFYSGDEAVIMNAEKFQNFMQILSASNSPFAKIGKNALRFNMGISKVATFFNYPSRILNSIVSRFDRTVGQGVRNFIGNFLKKFSSNADWTGAVDAFILKGIGIKQLIKLGVEKLLTSLGVAVGGPIGGAIAFALSELISDLVSKVVKPLFEFLVLAFIGFVGLVIFAVFFGFSNITALARHIVPGTCEECVEYNPHSGLYPEPPEDLPGEEYPPSDSLCPITYANPIICNQGPGKNPSDSDYHKKSKAIDVRVRDTPEGQDVWYAPTDGEVFGYVPDNYCRISGKNYGGKISFRDSGGNVYILLHIRAIKSSGHVSKGTAIAITRRDLEPDFVGYCWTGPHHHLEVWSGSTPNDAYDWYVDKLSCNINACP